MATDETNKGAQPDHPILPTLANAGGVIAAMARQITAELRQDDDDESAQSALAAELERWWHDQAQVEIEQVVPKAIEYGGVGSAVDLVWMGQEIAGMLGRRVDDQEATELGIWVYILGKVARWKAAILEGRRVSDDTLHDISVYCRMAQRNRAVGGWPYPNQERTE